MTAQTKDKRGFWQNLFRRDGGEVPEGPPAVAERTPQTAAPELEIEPNDPILAYLTSVSGVVEVERIDLDSPALRAMKAAEVKPVVPLVSQGELIGLLNLGPRLSQQEYSADDRKLLNDLATQTAPAVQVAQIFRSGVVVLRLWICDPATQHRERLGDLRCTGVAFDQQRFRPRVAVG